MTNENSHHERLDPLAAIHIYREYYISNKTHMCKGTIFEKNYKAFGQLKLYITTVIYLKCIEYDWQFNAHVW
jgi:hypothetical protein